MHLLFLELDGRVNLSGVVRETETISPFYLVQELFHPVHGETKCRNKLAVVSVGHFHAVSNGSLSFHVSTCGVWFHVQNVYFDLVVDGLNVSRSDHLDLVVKKFLASWTVSQKLDIESILNNDVSVHLPKLQVDIFKSHNDPHIFVLSSLQLLFEDGQVLGNAVSVQLDWFPVALTIKSE